MNITNKFWRKINIFNYHTQNELKNILKIDKRFSSLKIKIQCEELPCSVYLSVNGKLKIKKMLVKSLNDIKGIHAYVVNNHNVYVAFDYKLLRLPDFKISYDFNTNIVIPVITNPATNDDYYVCDLSLKPINDFYKTILILKKSIKMYLPYIYLQMWRVNGNNDLFYYKNSFIEG